MATTKTALIARRTFKRGGYFDMVGKCLGCHGKKRNFSSTPFCDAFCEELYRLHQARIAPREEEFYKNGSTRECVMLLSGGRLYTRQTEDQKGNYVADLTIDHGQYGQSPR